MKKLLLGISLIVFFVFAGCATSSLTYVFDPEIHGGNL
ncbi:hypothetical protein R84B8_02092 [Treponema sp. R8-4-B8]